MIHPAAIVDPRADVAGNVEIGPGSIIGADVTIGDATWIGPHVVINGPTVIGRRNRIYQFNSIGDAPQDRKYDGEPSRLEIGDDNVIREFCTINRGTGAGGGVTRVGDGNWIMAYVHIAHDCQVADETVMANGTTLAGHALVERCVSFGAFTVVHQFCAIGAYSFSAMGTVVLKDVPPFVTISGNFAKPHGINSEGLRRRGVDADTIRELRRAYKILFRQGLTTEQAALQLQERAAKCPSVARSSMVRLCEFLVARAGGRGIVR